MHALTLPRSTVLSETANGSNWWVNEYFHGDNGAGLGASQQTGWTGLVVCVIQLFGSPDAAKEIMKAGLESVDADAAVRAQR